MEVSVIASGSNGNCCLVEKKGVSILIDAGKSGRELEKRMNSLGRSLENVDALVLTHAHSDHVRGAGVVHRRYDIPIYSTRDTIEHSRNLGKIEVKYFSLNKSFGIKGIQVKPVKTSHAVPSSGFVIDKFGLFTDTGMVTTEMKKSIPKLKMVLLESNHDVDMLVNGPYPYPLKQHILSDHGHLSNFDACTLLESKGRNLDYIFLGHLSGHNNTPKVAAKTFESMVKAKSEYFVCSRENATGSWRI